MLELRTVAITSKHEFSSLYSHVVKCIVKLNLKNAKNMKEKHSQNECQIFKTVKSMHFSLNGTQNVEYFISS